MATEVQAEYQKFERNGDELRGFAAWPAAHDGPLPAVVLIPDVRGLYAHYEDVTRRLAAAGFFGFAIDLYSREGAPDLPDMEAVARWIRELPDRRVLADIGAGIDFVAGQASVRPNAVGITGFCLGGQYALMAACTVKRLAACVSWYGMLRYEQTNEAKPVSPLDLAPNLGCPYLGLFGADDALIPSRDVEDLRAILEREEKTFEIQVYEGAGHAFFNDSRLEMYRPEAAADAWKRALAFFREHLA